MTVLIYGAYGYTGELVAREAVDRGLDVVVAGRNGTKTRGLGIQLGAETRVFGVDDAAAFLEDVDALLNCAGPFAHTYEPLVDACLETGTAYLDITGELPVFEAIAERDRDAERAGVPLLPGIGFEVVPTDCLACHLHDRLPDATHLRLGIEATGSFSSGTIASALEHADGGGKVRHNGAIEDVPIGSTSRRIDFGNGPRNAIGTPLADVSTAYYTTGIGNIEAYTAVPKSGEWAVRFGRPAVPLLSFSPLKRGLQRLVRTFASDPSEAERNRGRAYIWGEATNGERTVVSRLETPEPYTLTVDSATTAVERLDRLDSLPTGFETPAAVFDADFVLELDDVEGFFDDESRSSDG